MLDMTKPKTHRVVTGMVNLNDIRIGEIPEHLKELAGAAQRDADIKFAASQLARLRHEARTRPARTYTGRVFSGRRAWRGMRVLLPNGRVGALYRVLRGVAVVQWRDEFALRHVQHAALGIGELKPFKLAAAMLLGARKRGVKERTSRRKARAARINGAAPPRPGSRARGRPRPTPPPSLAATCSG